MLLYKMVEIHDEVEVEVELTSADLAEFDTCDILQILEDRGVPIELLEPIKDFQRQKLVTIANLKRWVAGEGIPIQ